LVTFAVAFRSETPPDLVLIGALAARLAPPPRKQEENRQTWALTGGAFNYHGLCCYESLLVTY
jgi:hypothetical protein